MILIDNTVHITHLKKAIAFFIKNKKAIRGYNTKICNVYKEPILSGKNIGTLRKPLKNNSAIISKNLPKNYKLRTIYGFLYEIVKK